MADLTLSSGGQWLRLTVLGYDLPASVQNDYDANWLRIRVEVCENRGEFEREYACLLTWDIEHLANWFEALATNSPRLRYVLNEHVVDVASPLEFMGLEPNFNLQVLSTQSNYIAFRVRLELEFRPDWAPVTSVPMGDYGFDVSASKDHPREEALRLRDLLRRFPPRKGSAKSA